MEKKRLYILIITICLISAGSIIGIVLIYNVMNTATYEVTFTSVWSNATHPDASFPTNPHFSKLIGTTHNNKVAIWQVGGKSSEGMESMAETGNPDTLTAEIDAIIVQGNAYSTIFSDTGNIAASPGSAKVTFTIHSGFSYVSLVTMIAPSPDWFVGVDSLNLLNSDGTWKESIVVNLYAYDAGTDDGVSFGSTDADSNPAEDISRITVAPFPAGGDPLGTFTFTKK